jgi:aryl-alcohol dehydrogenase-like predicted oxidoreductase
METMQLGKTPVTVSVLGLGMGPLSKQGRPPEEQAIATIHRSLALGITLIDTADAYCIDESDKHYSERLLSKALQQYDGDTSNVTVITKGGFIRPDGDWKHNGNPEYLRKTIRASFEALGGEKAIDLWLYHSPDPSYTLKESLTPAKEAVDAGIVRFVGVSNFSLEQLKRARDIVEVVAIQNHYNLWSRKHEFDGMLAYCDREGLTFMPCRPLGGIGGNRRSKPLEKMPVLAEIAQAKGCSLYCLLLAWLRAKSSAIAPIVGASRVASIEDSVKSVSLTLSQDEIDAIDASSPPALFDRPVAVWAKRQVKKLIPVR